MYVLHLLAACENQLTRPTKKLLRVGLIRKSSVYSFSTWKFCQTRPHKLSQKETQRAFNGGFEKVVFTIDLCNGVKSYFPPLFKFDIQKTHPHLFRDLSLFRFLTPKKENVFHNYPTLQECTLIKPVIFSYFKNQVNIVLSHEFYFISVRINNSKVYFSLFKALTKFA